MVVSKALPAPLLFPVMAWTAGIVLARFIQPSFAILAVSACVLVLAAAFYRPLRLWLLLLLFVALGSLRYQSQPQAGSLLETILQQRNTLQQPIVFSVVQVFSNSENRYAVALDSLAGMPLKEDMLFTSELPLSPGKRYQGLAEIRPLLHDPILDIYPSRYAASAYQLGALQELKGKHAGLYMAKLRYKLMLNLDAKLGENAGWAKGLLLSDTASKNEYRDELSQSGIMHLIVVSGLHVWLIYLVLTSLLRIFLRRDRAELAFLPLILAFAALNNWAPPISRAIIMIGSLILARLLQKPLSGVQSLSLSMFIITLINPSALFSIGLQLSFMAVAVIMFGLPRFRLFPRDALHKQFWQRGMENLVHGVLLSLIVSIAICPITLYYFGRASLNGIIGNLGGIPLITMLLPLSGLILLMPRGFYFSHALKLAYEALVWLWQVWFKLCADLPFSLSGDYLSRSMALAMAVVIIWLLVLVRGKFRLALKLFMPCCIIAGSMCYFPLHKAHTTDVHIFSCAVADCSLMRFESGRTLMIDTGGGKGFTFSSNVPSEQTLLQDSWMQKSLLHWLSRTGIHKIDYLVLSHLHADHYGGLLSLLQSTGVEHIFVSQATTQQPLWQFFTSVPYFKPTTVHVIADTCSFWLGEAKLTFLHPDKGFVTKDENERSLVCRLDTAGKRILFTGDIGLPSEEYLLKNRPEQLACDYLKVPHHGSRYSSTQEFLAACQPQEAWVCTSSHNHFGFPHAETIERYHRANTRLRSTAEGSIRIKIDSHSAM